MKYVIYILLIIGMAVADKLLGYSTESMMIGMFISSGCFILSQIKD